MPILLFSFKKMNYSTLFSLNTQDFAKGLVVVIITAILGILQQMLVSHGLDFASYNWGQIGQIALTAGIGYLTKNLISDSNGKVLGTIG